MQNAQTDPYAQFRGAEKPGEAIFARLNALAEELTASERAVAEAEEALKLANERLRDVSEKQLPELMDSLGLKDFRTTSGLRIKVIEKIFASTAPSKDPRRHEAAMRWLDEHGHGALVKRLLYVGFDREEQKEADKLMAELSAKRYDVKQEKAVHPSTLKAWVTEMLAEGEEIPMDLFGVEKKRSAKVE